MSFIEHKRALGAADPCPQFDNFARMRSLYLDIFSYAELRLTQLYQKLGLKNIDNSVGLKVNELKDIKASHSVSKTSVKRIQSVCSELSPQVQIRNGIAHATMFVGTKSGEEVCFFQKASDTAMYNPIYLVYGSQRIAKIFTGHHEVDWIIHGRIASFLKKTDFLT